MRPAAGVKLAGALWLAAFSAADPGATVGTVGSAPTLPGGTASGLFSVDTALNRYFSFAAMVVPSNDFFLGNDNAKADERPRTRVVVSPAAPTDAKQVRAMPRDSRVLFMPGFVKADEPAG